MRSSFSQCTMPSNCNDDVILLWDLLASSIAELEEVSERRDTRALLLLFFTPNGIASVRFASLTVFDCSGWTVSSVMLFDTPEARLFPARKGAAHASMYCALLVQGHARDLL